MTSLLDQLGRHWYFACACVIAGVATANAALWIGVVPIFQALDEPAFFDYAYTIAQVGHPLRVGAASAGLDPRVSAATRVSETDAVAFSADRSITPSYGTRRFFERIRSASHAARRSVADRVSVGATLEPPGAPLLQWVAVLFTRDDVPSGIFAVRAFDAIAVGAAILLWATVFVRFDVPRVSALAVLAITAVFPLTAQVGSSVNPYAIVAACLPATVLSTLALRRAGGVGRAAAAGTLAGLTLLCFPPAALAVAVSSARNVWEGVRRRRTGATTFALVAPVAAALALFAWTGAPPTVLGTLTHAAERIDPNAVWAALVGALASESFWGDYGWLDTPIQFWGNIPSIVLREATKVGSAIIGALAVAALLRAARARNIAVTTVPAANLVLLYVVYGITLVVTAALVGTYATSGPAWYPLAAVAFLIAVHYAPRALPVTARVIASALIGAMLALYAGTSAFAAISTLQQRYYDYARPLQTSDAAHVLDLPLLAADPGEHVDELVVDGTPAPPAHVVRLPAHGELVIGGWVYDVGVRARCARVAVVIDDTRAILAKYGLLRQDAPQGAASAGLERTGFRGVISLDAIAPGRHRIVGTCVAQDGNERLRSFPIAAVEVEP